MTDFQEVAVKEILRSILGKTAKISLYGRDHRTPMTFVLDEVERQIGPRFSVYWVDDGSPEVFTLPGFSPSPVVFSARYFASSSVMRTLLVDEILMNNRADIAEHTTLKLMAEMALRYGDPDYAVLAFVKSVTVTDVLLIDNDEAGQVMTLESEPINEAYMATWFYGLVHELGHLHPIQTEHFPDSHPFSDTGILHMITVVLDDASYLDTMKHEILEKAKQHQSNSVLEIDQLRKEGLADIFAASVLFKTTIDIMQEINQERFEVARFIEEITIFLNVVAFIDRCRRVASVASATAANPEASLEGTLHPVSISVRELMVRGYLESIVARYSFGTDDPTSEQLQRAGELINEIHEQHMQQINLVDSGNARAMRFSLFPEQRENDWVLLEAFRKKLLDRSGVAALVEAQRFCKLADTLDADSKLLKVLKGIVDNPSKPLLPDPIGDLAYLVPWVEGPNGFNRPLGLDTKYGHLVFVFHGQSELYNVFFTQSTEMLKSTFTLKEYLIAVPRKERLAPELAAHMPEGQAFGVVVEGTEAFEQYMGELADDTIWEV